MRLVWSRTNGRHSAHIIGLGFAQPNHGTFQEDDEYTTICGELITAAQKATATQTHVAWKTCRKCLNELGRLIEQTMPEET